MNVAGDQYLVSLVRRQDNSFVLKDKDVSNSDIRELMKLDSGDYELQLRPKSSLLSGFGSFQFQIQTRDALPELSAETDVTIPSAPSRAAQAFQFSATAGDAIFLDLSSTPDLYTRWALFAPDGSLQRSAGGYNSYSYDRLDLAQTGQYVLCVYGDEGSISERATTVRLHRVADSESPLRLGERVSGRLAGPGDVARYTLTLDSDRTVLFDPQGGDVTVRLNNASTGNLLTFYPGSTTEYYGKFLSAGKYSIEVSASGRTTSDYAFSVYDTLSAAVQHGDSTQISGELPAGRQLVIHSFDVVAGQTYNLDFILPTSSAEDIRFTLMDAQGRELVGTSWSSYSSVSFSAARSGTIYLLAKQYAATSAPVRFEAALRQPVGVTQALSWGTLTQGTLNTRHDKSDFSFQMTQPGWLDLQGIVMSKLDESIEILSADGARIYSGSGWSSPWTSLSRYLPAGDYVLRINSNYDGEAVSFAFKASQVLPTQRLDRQLAVSREIALESSDETVGLWSLAAMAGDVLRLARNSWDGTGTVEIIRPSGYSLATWDPSRQASLDLKLSEGGEYLVRVQRDGLDTLASNAISLSATWGFSTVVPPLTSTFEWSGTLQANASTSFQFELTEPGAWYLDRKTFDSSAYFYSSISIKAADGREVLSKFDEVVALQAGVYTVTLEQGSSAGTQSLQVRKLGADEGVTPITYGQRQILPDATHYASLIYRINAEALDVLQFNALGGAGNTPRNWRLYNRFGQQIGSGNMNKDSAEIRLASAGACYLVFDQPGWSMDQAFKSGGAFQIDRVNGRQPGAVVLNEAFALELDASTQSRSFRFDLSDARLVMFDRLNGAGGYLQWRLRDLASDAVVTLGWSLSSMEGSVSALPAGRYELTVETDEFNAISERIRVVDLSSATQVSKGEAIEGRLQPTGEMLAYSVEAQAGDRIFVDFKDLLARVYATGGYNYTAKIRVVDPFGRSASVGDVLDSGTEVVAATSGRYTILLDEQSAQDVPLPFRMYVYVNRPGLSRQIDLQAAPRERDLVVSDVAVKGSAAGEVIQSGSDIQVSWTTRNQGEKPTIGDFIDRVIVKRT
jgi:hypothetical protein